MVCEFRFSRFNSLKRIDSFQIYVTLEAKFAYNSLSNYWPFKQIHGKSTLHEQTREKGKKNILLDATHLDNHDDNILRHFDISANFPLATSETKRDY